MSSLTRRRQVRAFKARNVEQIFWYKGVAKSGEPKTFYRWPFFAFDVVRPMLAPRRKPKTPAKARWNGKRWVRQTTTKRPTFKVPSQPVRSTRADRQIAHKAKMLRKAA